jgi:golgin subfamily B member 1
VLSTDKILLKSLDEERVKYSQLETEYHKLLQEFHTYQKQQTGDSIRQQTRSEVDLKSLQKAFVLKSEECAELQRNFQEMEGYYQAEMRKMSTSRSGIESLLKESESKCTKLNQTIEELKYSKLDLTDRLKNAEEDLKDAKADVRERELICVKEKELRAKLELQIAQMDNSLEKQSGELDELRKDQNTKNQQLQEMDRLKGEVVDLKKKIDTYGKREKIIKEENSTLYQVQKEIEREIDQCRVEIRQLNHDLARISAHDSMLAKDVDQLKQIESLLREDLHLSLKKNEQMNKEIVDLENLIQEMQQSNEKWVEENNVLKMNLQESKSKAQERDRIIAECGDRELDFKHERELFSHEMAISKRECRELQGQIQQLAQRLDSEMKMSADNKLQNKERVLAMSSQIADAQHLLEETQKQVENLKQNEVRMKSSLMQREQVVQSQENHLKEQHDQILQLQSHIAKLEFSFESSKTKAKDDFESHKQQHLQELKEKEDEIQNLKHQISQKTNQFNNTVEEINRLKKEISNVKGERFRIEAMLAEAHAGNSMKSHQIESLEQQLFSKEQEVKVLMIKQRKF